MLVNERPSASLRLQGRAKAGSGTHSDTGAGDAQPGDAQPGETLTSGALIECVLRLASALRSRGVEVTLSEVIDAQRAASLVELASRAELLEALRTTMVKHSRHFGVFEAAFDRLFPLRPERLQGRGALGETPADGLAALIASGGDLRAAAAELVDAYGGLDGTLRGERHHLRRVFRGADLARLMSASRRADPAVAPEDLRTRIDALKRLITADIRGRLGGANPSSPDGDGLGDAFDVDFLAASRAELALMRDAVRPLARGLAGRIARRRRRVRAGRVNMRRTVRVSLSTGGVPITLAHDRPRKRRPELFVLCDISGSVAEFSMFTLTLMASLSAEVSRTRSFVFVDAIDEITGLLNSTGHGIEPWQLMRNANANAVGGRGHSDYGAVLSRFWATVGCSDLRPASTLLITGDARTNHLPARADVLARVAGRCRRTYWLNPEPRRQWDTFDSRMSAYAAHCTEAFEVRNLRQLAACVASIM